MFSQIKPFPPREEEAVLSITLKELVPGMVFPDDVKEAGGMLILAAGHVATSVSVNRLKEMGTRFGYRTTIPGTAGKG